MEVTDITETQTDDQITTITVTVKHSGIPPNAKTFEFTVQGNDVVFAGMTMRKGDPWTYSERELLTISDAKTVAREEAMNRLELADIMSERVKGTEHA